jgi:hypothetical protein
MHATIRHYANAPGLVDGVVANEDAIRKLLQDIDGFRAYYIVSTGGAGAISVSVYDDRSGAEESNTAARGWIAANLPDLAASPPEVYEGEVGVAF